MDHPYAHIYRQHWCCTRVRVWERSEINDAKGWKGTKLLLGTLEDSRGGGAMLGGCLSTKPHPEDVCNDGKSQGS
jgi:hypothetical protein